MREPGVARRTLDTRSTRSGTPGSYDESIAAQAGCRPLRLYLQRRLDVGHAPDAAGERDGLRLLLFALDPARERHDPLERVDVDARGAHHRIVDECRLDPRRDRPIVDRVADRLAARRKHHREGEEED